MKRFLLLVCFLVVGLAAMVSCGNKEKAATTETSAVESAEEQPVTTPSLPGTMSMDDYEHKFASDWRQYQIKVEGQKKSYEPDIKAIYDAVVEVFPLPMLKQWAVAGSDTPGAWTRQAETLCDPDNYFLSGKWIDPSGNFDDHFELKAWQVNLGTWLVGLNYQPLWDGDDGIGVYGNQIFWWYAPYGDATLSPIEDDEDHPRLPDAGDPHFDREESTISYPDAPDPSAALLHFNGWWFVHW